MKLKFTYIFFFLSLFFLQMASFLSQKIFFLIISKEGHKKEKLRKRTEEERKDALVVFVGQ